MTKYYLHRISHENEVSYRLLFDYGYLIPKESSQWVKDWTKKQQDDKKHCLANLLPISGSLNSSIQNADYTEKRERYLNDSALKAPREFAKNFSTWTPADFDERAKSISVWALKR